MPTAISPTVRDIKILDMIYSYDSCSPDHIRQKLFGGADKSKRGPKVACHRRLAILKQRGYLTAYRLSALSGVGSGKHLLGLTAKGRKALADELELSLSKLRRLREIQTPHAGAHHLAVCDVRLSVELACERSPTIDWEWVSERELRTPPITKVADPRKRQAGGAALEIPLIPDGQLVLRLPEYEDLIFRVEVDLGTIPAKRMLSKLAGYLALTQESPVLWVAPDTRRLEAIASWALKLASELGADPSIFWVTTKNLVTPQTILTSIWRVVGGPEKHSLLPEGEGWS